MNPTHESVLDRFASFEAISVTDDGLARIEGGVVTIEYLVLGTFLALSMIVGIEVTAPRQPVSTRR